MSEINEIIVNEQSYDVHDKRTHILISTTNDFKESTQKAIAELEEIYDKFASYTDTFFYIRNASTQQLVPLYITNYEPSLAGFFETDKRYEFILDSGVITCLEVGIPTNSHGEPIVSSVRLKTPTVTDFYEEFGYLDATDNKNIVLKNKQGNISINSTGSTSIYASKVGITTSQSHFDFSGDTVMWGRNKMTLSTQGNLKIEGEDSCIHSTKKLHLRSGDGESNSDSEIILSKKDDIPHIHLDSITFNADIPQKVGFHTNKFAIYDKTQIPLLNVEDGDIKLRANGENQLLVEHGKIRIITPEIIWIEKIKGGGEKVHLLTQTLAKIEENENRLERLESLMSGTVVDLGLPSGLLWAKCNIGAEKETDYGKYFQWGDTVGYYDASHSSWSTAPFNNGSDSFDETYFNGHKSEWLNGDILKPQYDAATQNMGGNWRMPTKADFDELLANTTHEWVQVNGVNGRKFTSKSDSSKYIFIPAAGDAINQGNVSNVWSSSLHTYHGSAWILEFDSEDYDVDEENHFYGFSVRGVLA